LEFEDQKILFIDTPGLSFISKGEDNEDKDPVDGMVVEECRARDILLRSKGRVDRLKDPNPPSTSTAILFKSIFNALLMHPFLSVFCLVTHIVSRANTEDLMLMYSLPAFAKGDPTAFLSGVARANHLLKKVSTDIISRIQRSLFPPSGNRVM
jgi:nuclear GTP-binding protein